MSKQKKEKLPRTHKLYFALNDKEYKVLKKYMKQYRIYNRANLVRKALFTYILEQFDKDYPSLFSKNDSE